MRYTILITAVGSPRAGKIVAHHLAGNRNVSLSYAQSLLENVPVVYQTDLTKDETDAIIKRLIAIGVQVKAVPTASLSPIPKEPPGESDRKSPPFGATETDQQSTPEKAPAASPALSFVYRETVTPTPTVKTVEMKKRLALGGIVVIIVFGVIAFLTAEKKWQPRLQSPMLSLLGADSTQPGEKTVSSPVSDEGSSIRHSGRLSISKEDLLRSGAFVDSGKASSEANDAVAFYKMAIGFNKFNVGAWYGLIAAYAALGMEDEQRESEKAMAAIFGQEIFTVSKIVEQFGELVDSYTTTDGACHIDYRSRESKKDALQSETYMLVKALATRKDCLAFSFYVRAGNGRGGVLVYIAGTPVPDSFQQYRLRAKITVFE
jgi:hypothetical protein